MAGLCGSHEWATTSIGAPDDWPVALRALAADYDAHQALMKTGRTIYFIQLEDVETSSTEIRRKMRFEQAIHELVPARVEEYIRCIRLWHSRHRW